MRKLEHGEILDEDSQWVKELGASADLDRAEGGLSLPEEIMATLNNSFEHECLEEAVTLLGANHRPDSMDDGIRG